MVGSGQTGAGKCAQHPKASSPPTELVKTALGRFLAGFSSLSFGERNYLLEAQCPLFS